MVSIEDTFDVPADTYSHVLPSDYDEDTVEIGVTAFSDKLYLKFPRFDRRGTNDMCMSADAIFEALVQTDSYADFEVKPSLRRMGVLRKRESDFGSPSDADSAASQSSADFVTGDDSDVATTHISPSSAHPAHLKVVGEFCETIADFQEDDYWQGYKRAANKFGDEMYDWSAVAWDVFDTEWDGNKELLLDVGKWFANEGWAVCSKTKALFPAPEWSTPTGSYVSTMSDVHSGKCPECGADKDEHWECYSSSNRTRVPDKYKCEQCGARRNGITTG